MGTRRYRRVKARWVKGGVRRKNFNRWKRTHPDGKKALAMVKKNRATIANYLGDYMQSRIQGRYPYPQRGYGKTFSNGGNIIVK